MMIFCVEDDEGIRELMIYTLNAGGFQAKGCADGTALTEALKTEIPELITLDIMLPGDDGITILKRLRSNPSTAHIPVIMASAKGTEYDKVVGLDLGADDYLAKPFGMIEMLSRVKAVLRRTAPPESQPKLCIGKLEMNLAEHTVTVDGKRVELTLKEYDLLRLFMDNQGIVFSRNKLLDLIWSEDYVGESRTVDVHIATLRTKLGVCGKYIKTLRGVGYKMEMTL